MSNVEAYYYRRVQELTEEIKGLRKRIEEIKNLDQVPCTKGHMGRYTWMLTEVVSCVACWYDREVGENSKLREDNATLKDLNEQFVKENIRLRRQLMLEDRRKRREETNDQ